MVGVDGERREDLQVPDAEPVSSKVARTAPCLAVAVAASPGSCRLFQPPSEEEPPSPPFSSLHMIEADSTMGNLKGYLSTNGDQYRISKGCL